MHFAVAYKKMVFAWKYWQAMLMWKNTGRLEETFYGPGTSHWLNGIADQARYFGPGTSFRPLKLSKLRYGKEVISVVLQYNAGDCCDPFARAFVEVAAEEILAKARKKNLLRILWLHANERLYLGTSATSQPTASRRRHEINDVDARRMLDQSL